MPTYRCRKTKRAPAVDGAIDPKVWRLAQPVPLVLADSGKPPLQPTEARMLYDDDFLYAAFHCVDSDAWGSYIRGCLKNLIATGNGSPNPKESAEKV